MPSQQTTEWKSKKAKERQVPRPCQSVKKAVEHECDGDTNCNWCTWNGTQKLWKVAGKLEIRRRIETISIIEIGLNTEKSPGDLKRL